VQKFWKLLKNEALLLLRTFFESLRAIAASAAFDRAAAISYYAVLAVFPFILIVVLVGGRVLRNPALAGKAIEFLSQRIPVAGDFLSNNLTTLQKAAGGLGMLSALGLLWSAMGLFSALRNGMDDVCGTPRKSFLKGHWYSLAAVFLAAVGLIVLLGLSTLLGLFGSLEAVQWLDALVPFLPLVQLVSRLSGQVVSLFAFLFLLHYLPTVRPHLRDCLVPSLAVALLEQTFRYVFVSFLLSRQDLNPVHGPLSAAIGFLGWAYASSFLVLWGSLWSRTIQNRRTSEPF